MLTSFGFCIAILALAGWAEMTPEQANAQLTALIVASALLPWGWICFRGSIFLGILGIIQIAAVGYITLRSYRFLRSRIQRFGLHILSAAAIYCIACVATNLLGVLIMFTAPTTLPFLFK